MNGETFIFSTALLNILLLLYVFQGGPGNNGLDGSPGVDGAKVTVIPCDLFTNKSASY